MSSILKVDTIQTAAGGTPTAADLGLNVSGSVLQVVSTIKTDRWSSSVLSAGWSSDITGFTATITPKFANSKILIQFTLNHDTSSVAINGPRILQDGSVITSLLGDADGSRTRTTLGLFYSPEGREINNSTGSFVIDAGSTATRTYSFQLYNPNTGTQTLYVNRSGQYSNDFVESLPVSSLIVMEIAG